MSSLFGVVQGGFKGREGLHRCAEYPRLSGTSEGLSQQWATYYPSRLKTPNRAGCWGTAEVPPGPEQEGN